jgi:hypothetical protein
VGPQFCHQLRPKFDFKTNFQTRSGPKVMMAQIDIQMARIHKSINEIDHGNKAEKLYKSALDVFTDELGALNIQTLNLYQEYVKFLIKEDRCAVSQTLFQGFINGYIYSYAKDAKKHLLLMIENQKKCFGNFHMSLNSSYKLLITVLLRLKDVQSSSLYFKKVLFF